VCVYSCVCVCLCVCVSLAGSGGPAGGAQLAELISRLLSGGGPAAASGPELLPVLQSLCGQVTKLRLDDAEEEEMKKRNGSWWVEFDKTQIELIPPV